MRQVPRTSAGSTYEEGEDDDDEADGETLRFASLHPDRSPFSQVSRLSLDLRNLIVNFAHEGLSFPSVWIGKDTGLVTLPKGWNVARRAALALAVQGPQKLPEDKQGNTVVGG